MTDRFEEDSEAELIRKRHLYRRLIVQGKVRLSLAAAIRMVGPDCAFHLYGHEQPREETCDASHEEPREGAGEETREEHEDSETKK